MLSKKFFRIKPNNTPDKIYNTDQQGFQMDLKHMPIDPNGYRYVLVLVSLFSGEVDAIPLKTKTMGEVTKGLQVMMKRKYIRSIGKMRYIGVDKGSEFLNTEMRAFLASKNVDLIAENTTIHINSTAVIERMISTITRDVHIYLTQKSYELKKPFNDWLPVLNDVVLRTNNERRMKPKHITPQELIKRPPIVPANMIPFGTKVFKFYTMPVKPNGEYKYKFRNGDLRYNPNEPGIVTNYLVRPGRPIRFFLDNNITVSYNRHELLAEYEL